MIKEIFKIIGKAIASLSRKQDPVNSLKWNDTFKVEHIRNGCVINEFECKNDITNVGKNDLLDVYFKEGTQTLEADFCIGLINASGYTGVAAGDTMGSHSGWAEFTSYSQANRVAWGQGAPASQAITNSSPATFDITATATLKGVFVPTEDTKGGTTGTLWATALFAADVNVVNGDQLRITYTVSA